MTAIAAATDTVSMSPPQVVTPYQATIQVGGQVWIRNSFYVKERKQVKSLSREVSNLRAELDKLRGPRAEAAMNKAKAENERLSHKMEQLEEEIGKQKKRRWECEERYKKLSEDYTKLLKQKLELEVKLKNANRQNQELQAETEGLNNRLEAAEQARDKARLEALQKDEEIAHLTKKEGADSTNTGLPSSQTPIGTEKPNPRKDRKKPNGRRKSDKNRGGQKGHKKSTLSKCVDEAITGFENHVPDAFADQLNEDGSLPDGFKCPECGAFISADDIDNPDGRQSGLEIRYKDEIDFKVKVIKTRHRFISITCASCGKTWKIKIPKNLKMDCQYGDHLRTFILLLARQGLTSVNRIQKIINGLLEIDVSEGFICKVNQIFGSLSEEFVDELAVLFEFADMISWDDTVVYSQGKRINYRTYVTRWATLFTAHDKKNLESLIDDGILTILSADTIVMHDHCTINYNDIFHFLNVECNQHLLRDLKRLADAHKCQWADIFRKRLQEMIALRNDMAAKNENSLPQNVIDDFTKTTHTEMEEQRKELDKRIADYVEEQRRLGNTSPDINPRESDADLRRILNRLQNSKYWEAYFRWMGDFSIPVTNNNSERAFRLEKIHMKISGQFYSTETAQRWANGQTYLKTCEQNGISNYKAIYAMVTGRRFTAESLGLPEKMRQSRQIQMADTNFVDPTNPPPG